MERAGATAPNPSEKDSVPTISRSKLPSDPDSVVHEGDTTRHLDTEAPVSRGAQGSQDPDGNPTDAHSGAQGAAEATLETRPMREDLHSALLAPSTSDSLGARALLRTQEAIQRAVAHPSSSNLEQVKKNTGARKKDTRKTHNEPPPEQESQFILRLPPGHATTVRNLLRSGNTNMKDKLKIEFCSDERRAIVKVEGDSLSAKMVNLPCAVESLKTFDKKTFYKTADISQMLVCSADPDYGHSAPEKPVPLTDLKPIKKSEKEKQKKYNWKHGITPPLKNVRKRRFRKTKKNPDVPEAKEDFTEFTKCPEVDKELKILLRSDAEAVSVRWEVIGEDGTKEIESHASNPDRETIGHKPAQVLPAVEIQKQIAYVEKKLKKIQIKVKRQEDLIQNMENLTLKNSFQHILQNLKREETQRNEELILLQEQMKCAEEVETTQGQDINPTLAVQTP